MSPFPAFPIPSRYYRFAPSEESVLYTSPCASSPRRFDWLDCASISDIPLFASAANCSGLPAFDHPPVNPRLFSFSSPVISACLPPFLVSRAHMMTIFPFIFSLSSFPIELVGCLSECSSCLSCASIHSALKWEGSFVRRTSRAPTLTPPATALRSAPTALTRTPLFAPPTTAASAVKDM